MTVSRVQGLGIPFHARRCGRLQCQRSIGHEQIGPDGLRAGVAAPDAADHTGDQEQRDRAQDQQAGKQPDVLRPELQVEEVKPFVIQVQQHGLVRLVRPAVPAQPGQQVIERQAAGQYCPFRPAHPALHGLRVDPHAIGEKMLAGFLLLDLQLALGLTDARHAYSPPPREWTYSVTALMVAGSRRAFQFGITPWRGRFTWATMVALSSP